ncbi:RRP12 [Cordylochernes scorpioides]|uniref:RRP12 n=1 Tax=Cordylochernes scorpioides TaxID=51811 RepID=A0ABY6JXX7_9ARAC|nr:RRP12 [Cordylochernes scorpioides]
MGWTFSIDPQGAGGSPMSLTVAFAIPDAVDDVGHLSSAVVAWSQPGHRIDRGMSSDTDGRRANVGMFYAKSPVDLVSSFKDVAPVIGEGLESSPILRTILLRALNHLCKAATHNKESKAVLGSYSKNFLPILFNLYCEAENEEVYAAILAYVTLSGKELCSEYLTTLIEALQSEEATSTGAQLDLCRALLPYTSSKFLPTLLEIIESMLSSPQEDICLKALLVLQEYCQCSTKIMAKFFQSNIETLHHLLEVVPEVSTESIQAQQLYCLTVFVRSLKECTTLEELIMKVLPHIKSPSKEVREAAYNLLVELGRSSMRWGNQQSGLTDYLTLIQRGLDADPHTTSLTLLALTRLGFDFSTQLPPDFLSSLVVRVSQHIPSASQEIHMACLSFLKLLLTTFPRDTLEPHLKILARKLCASIKHKSRPLKHAIKTLLLQVIKKFGQEQVYKMLGKQEQREVFKKLTKTGKDEKASMDGYGGAASVLMLESAAKASASMLGTASNYRQSQTFTKVCLDHNAMINESCTPIPHSMRSDVAVNFSREATFVKC